VDTSVFRVNDLLLRDCYTSELEKNVGKEVVLAGWVHDVRLVGGINFIILRDKDGMAQITVLKKDATKQMIDSLQRMHQEDVIIVKGKVVRSKIAKIGVEVMPSTIEVMTSSKVPLPLDPRQVTPANLDTKLNQRFLDLRTMESRAIFRIQAQITKSFREFLTARGYMEIQPPCIISSASEGGAELFSFPYFEKQAFLAQSPQLYKQICAMAFEKVFSIMPVFRAEKFDQPTHLNEIRQMDIEQAFADHNAVMGVLEEVFVFILEDVKKNCGKELELLGQKLEIPRLPLKRMKYAEAVALLKKAGEKVELGEDFTKTQEKLLLELVKDDAFFITDWPSDLRAFYAMPSEKDPSIVNAFDFIYKGIELASGSQRVHIPELLEKKIREKGLNPENFKFYIDTFRYGSAVHAGWAIGLERFTMKVTGRSNIREACMFPRDRTRITP
jgi:nondiscriminating aspartyl-tRNA synthetase